MKKQKRKTKDFLYKSQLLYLRRKFILFYPQIAITKEMPFGIRLILISNQLSFDENKFTTSENKVESVAL